MYACGVPGGGHFVGLIEVDVCTGVSCRGDNYCDSGCNNNNGDDV